jgi:hypothetical protein
MRVGARRHFSQGDGFGEGCPCCLGLEGGQGCHVHRLDEEVDVAVFIVITSGD